MPPASTVRALSCEATNTRLRVFSSGKNDTMSGRSFDDANAFQRTMRTLAATKVGAAVLRPTANHLDQLVSRLTGGKRSFAGIVTGVPAVLLTTTGAKSGQPRTVTVYGIPHPDGVALIASNWGGAKNPAWVPQSQGQPRGHGTYRGRYLACHRPARHTQRARRDLGERPRVLPRLEEVRSTGGRTPDRGVRPPPELSPDQACVMLRRPSSTDTLSPGPVARPRFRSVHSRICSEY